MDLKAHVLHLGQEPVGVKRHSVLWLREVVEPTEGPPFWEVDVGFFSLCPFFRLLVQQEKRQ